MNANEILCMIDESKIRELGALHQIDQVNTKITGEFILKVFVKGALEGYPMSLRSIEELCNNKQEISSLLKAKNSNKKSIDHSSVGKRLKKMNVDFFKAIYEDIVIKYNEKFVSENIKDKFHRFDSTIIKLSGKLLKDGLNLGGKEVNRHIKMSIGLKNSIPSSVRFCSEQKESSEDIALVNAINEAKVDHGEILLFDRGIAKCDSFRQFDKQEKYFITRVNVNRKYKPIKSNEIVKSADCQLDIRSDEIVQLYKKGGKLVKHNLRLIKAHNSASEELWFLTNVLYLSSEDVANSYKKRWDIEVLFKFLKQHLQFKKFINHTLNGMSIYIYCLLIAAILFTIYKITNKLKGYKIALLKFSLELHKSIIKDIVLFCGGNPDLVELKL